MEYYHLVVIGENKHKSKIVNETSLEQINKKCKEYLSKKDFLINGNKFNYDNIISFNIYKTESKVEDITNILNKEIDPSIIIIYDDYDALENNRYSINITGKIVDHNLITNNSKNENMENKNIFIIYGRDENLLDKVELLLQKLKLNPFKISSDPDSSRTIIAKFKDRVNTCCYAIALLTPDDVGKLANENNKMENRVRQNVLFEFGYVLGKLGDEKVSILKKGEIDFPSDLSGISYIDYNDSDWKHKIVNNMKKAGLNVTSDDI